jgi:hypothetical protein
LDDENDDDGDHDDRPESRAEFVHVRSSAAGIARAGEKLTLGIDPHPKPDRLYGSARRD